MKTLLFAALLIIGVTACSAQQPTPTLPPDIPATVTAQVQAHLDVLPTSTPLPTHTPYPMQYYYGFRFANEKEPGGLIRPPGILLSSRC